MALLYSQLVKRYWFMIREYASASPWNKIYPPSWNRRPRTGNIFLNIYRETLALPSTIRRVVGPQPCDLFTNTDLLCSVISYFCPSPELGLLVSLINVSTSMSLASFPVHFFSTVWLGEIYIKSHSNTLTDPAIINQEASRVGSRALFYAALLSFVSSVVSPILVGGVDNAEKLHGWRKWARLDIVQLWAIANVFFGVCLFTML
jgi:hypothetical protein